MMHAFTANPWRYEELADELISMLDDGIEFPDAEYRLREKHGLSDRQWRAVVREMDKD